MNDDGYGYGYDDGMDNHNLEKVIKRKELRVGKYVEFCMKMKNPYPHALKYNLFFVSNEFLKKPKDFLVYFNHAKKEKV